MAGTNDITAKTIKALRTEARAAGDMAMVETCGRALKGEEDAVETVRQALADAADACDPEVRS